MRRKPPPARSLAPELLRLVKKMQPNNGLPSISLRGWVPSPLAFLFINPQILIYMRNKLSLSRNLAIGAIALAAAFSSNAQLKTPAASPAAVLKQTVGLTGVEIDYSRPSMRGREIFGGLVPYGAIWRTGANQPTKLTFSDDVQLGGADIPAGTYALYTIPEEDEWTIIIYEGTELWGAFGYDESNDVARFKAKPISLERPVETFTIGVGFLRSDSATIYLEWSKTRIELPLKVPTHEKVTAQINALKDKPEFRNPNTLFAAGTYYHESGKDLETAHEWVSEAVAKSEKPAYWMFARKARIEADLGKTEEARRSAEKTLELAKEGNNPDYQKIARDILASL